MNTNLARKQKGEPYIEDLISVIDYQGGSVVSKTIVKKKAGTITMFAFDTGQGLPEHAVHYDAILFVTDGNLSITVGNEDAIFCNSGEMAFLPADVPHSVVAVTPCKMFLIMIRSRE